MRIYLSAVLTELKTIKNSKDEEFCQNLLRDTHVLQSFAYNFEGVEKYYPYCKSLMLDSGAFTVMNSKSRMSNFEPMKYCKAYAEHIKKNNIDTFIELDIESVYGFDVYRDCLHQLEDITGKEPIYVFHKWRGLDYFEELVRQKKYIALGDVSVGGGSRKLYKYFPWFLNKAHENNCKVHGLAFTSIPDLRVMPFDSVDSSRWLSGGRYARVSRFDGHNLNIYDCTRDDEKRLMHNSIVKRHDFTEWKKLSSYYEQEYEPIW